jgi:hypothetical protein
MYFFLLQQACLLTGATGAASEQALLVDYEQVVAHSSFCCGAFYSSSNGDFNIIHFQFNSATPEFATNLIRF